MTSFSDTALAIGKWAGTPWAFGVATGSVVVWASSHGFFESVDTWMLIIGTYTTIVTFLMVFLIQGAGERNTLAILVKLDELIRASDGARNSFIRAEKKDDGEMQQIGEELDQISDRLD